MNLSRKKCNVIRNRLNMGLGFALIAVVGLSGETAVVSHAYLAVGPLATVLERRCDFWMNWLLESSSFWLSLQALFITLLVPWFPLSLNEFAQSMKEKIIFKASLTALNMLTPCVSNKKRKGDYIHEIFIGFHVSALDGRFLLSGLHSTWCFRWLHYGWLSRLLYFIFPVR